MLQGWNKVCFWGSMYFEGECRSTETSSTVDHCAPSLRILPGKQQSRRLLAWYLDVWKSWQSRIHWYYRWGALPSPLANQLQFSEWLTALYCISLTMDVTDLAVSLMVVAPSIVGSPVTKSRNTDTRMTPATLESCRIRLG